MVNVSISLRALAIGERVGKAGPDLLHASRNVRTDRVDVERLHGPIEPTPQAKAATLRNELVRQLLAMARRNSGKAQNVCLSGTRLDFANLLSTCRATNILECVAESAC